jgi:hypothetical protein
MKNLRTWALLALGTGTAVAVACIRDGTSGPPPPPPPTPGTHVGYYVVQPPYGTSAGTGTTDDPWDLATALQGGHGNTIQPGDTVWLRGGTYSGSFRTDLQGTAAAPIVFRQYPGERATIDGSLRTDGAYLTFWGFEIMQSRPLQVVDRVLEANTANGRFINLVLHDAGFSGVDMAADAGPSRLYGSIVYNNGWRDIDRRVCHERYRGNKLHHRQRVVQQLRARHPGLRGWRSDPQFPRGGACHSTTRSIFGPDQPPNQRLRPDIRHDRP